MPFTIRPEWVWWAIAVLGGAYLLSASVVILRRLVFERQRRLLERLEVCFADASHGRERAVAAVAAAPASLLWTLAADSSIPRRVHQLVAESLVRRQGAPALSALASRTNARGARRIAALRALALTGAADTWALLRATLVDASTEVVAATVSLLTEMGDRRAAALLIDLLISGSHPRSRVATALESFSADIWDLLVPLLTADNAIVRYWGTMLLRNHPAGPGTLERLEALAGDADPMVRKAALYALARLGGAETSPVAVRCLADPVPYVRAYAVRALAAWTVPGNLGPIVPLLADRDWWVRSAVKEALAAAGESMEPALLPYLTHPDPFARNGAAEVLQNTGGFERLVLREAAGRPDPARRSLIGTLADAGGVRMWESVLTRLPEHARERAREILTAVRLSAGV